MMLDRGLPVQPAMAGRHAPPEEYAVLSFTEAEERDVAVDRAKFLERGVDAPD